MATLCETCCNLIPATPWTTSICWYVKEPQSPLNDDPGLQVCEDYWAKSPGTAIAALCRDWRYLTRLQRIDDEWYENRLRGHLEAIRQEAVNDQAS